MSELGQKAYDKAVKLLSIRMHTTGELTRKLKIRGFKDIDIKPVLRQLEEQKFLDDRKFAEIFVDNLKRYRDFGYWGIKAKLLAKQIPSDLAESALSEYFTPADELQVSSRIVEKLKKQGKKDWKVLATALQRRGFRNETINLSLRGS